MAKAKRRAAKAEEPSINIPDGPPPGVKLLHTLRGHTKTIFRIAWSNDGRWIASGGAEGLARIWDAEKGVLHRSIGGGRDPILSVAFGTSEALLATGSRDGRVALWNAATGRRCGRLAHRTAAVLDVSFSADGHTLATGTQDGCVLIWDRSSGKLHAEAKRSINSIFALAFERSNKWLAAAVGTGDIVLIDPANGTEQSRTIECERGLYSLCCSPSTGELVAGGGLGALFVLDPSEGRVKARLEGHTGTIGAVAFAPSGRLLASRDDQGIVQIRRCDTWELVATLRGGNANPIVLTGLAFHPTLPRVASVGTTGIKGKDQVIHVWEFDPALLLDGPADPAVMSAAVHHTTAKVVVVGDSGVGKTGLGWRLAHGQFKEHASTHGQQFWVLDELRCRRTDGTECEAILWDLAGQPDYRLTHALFLDEADLALVVFDPTDIRDPLHGVEFWLKQLGACRAASPGSNNGCPIFLIGARADRGTSRLTQDELDEFCRTHGIAGGYLSTSAKAGDGVADLIERMRAAIPWDAKATTVTTATFKRIKDHVLKLKENRRRRKLIVSPAELRALLQKLDKAWRFTDEEMMAAVGNLQNYGYVKRLRTSEGAERVLLAPELLNNLAASFVLEARRSPKGLGSLDERKLLGGEYAFPELDKLPADQRAIMLDSAALLFLDHHVCFRETDPLGGQTYLVFPELINLKKPATGDEKPVEDGVAYTVGGAVENVMASLVVLMGYTDKFTRTNQWQNHARYEVGKGLVCGFRLEAERDGEMDLVLYFAAEVGPPIRQLFQGLFESFLARRNLTVARYEPVLCKNGHALDRSVLREHARTGSDVAYCSKCGDRLTLPKTAAPIQLTRVLEQQVVAQQTAADLRTRFEAAIFQVRTHVEAKGIHRPSCFISYAWGDPDQERWVERPLASDLRKAGIDVLLDQWHNAQIGKNVGRFVDRLEKVDRIIVVGTPRYREKYDNAHPDRGFVVAAEADIIMKRMQGSEAQKESVLPILREGTEATSFPPLIQGRVYADLRHERLYFFKAFDVILSLYEIAVDDPAVADLRTSLLFDRRLLGENVTFVR